jgi:ketosteroid isomerase-like protein
MEQESGAKTGGFRQVIGFPLETVDPPDNSGLLSVTPMRNYGFKLSAFWTLRLVFSLGILLAWVAGPLSHAMPRAEKHETRHEIDRLEDEWRNAILGKDVKAIDALLADDYMAITANGTLESKDESLANLRNGVVQFKSIEFSDRKVRFYGTTALVTCRAEVIGSSAEGDLSGSYRFTRVYARDTNGTWRAVSFEASRIRDPGDRKHEADDHR